MMDVTRARQLWHDLHHFADIAAIYVDNVEVDLDQQGFMSNWFAHVKATLECSSCWRKVEYFCRLWPVAYGDGLRLWSICLHDYVNKELGRPLYHPDLTLAPLTEKGIVQ